MMAPKARAQCSEFKTEGSRFTRRRHNPCRPSEKRACLASDRLVAFTLAATLFSVLFVSQAAAAALRTCVDVRASKEDSRPLQRLVESELDRHPSHQRAAENCTSRLIVELIEVSGERVLTARFDSEVPYRTAVAEGHLVASVTEALKVVLHNDPRVLRGPRESGWFSERMHDFRIEGENYYGVDFLQSFSLVAGRLQSLPGLALSAQREAGPLFVGARLSGASSLGAPSGDLALTEQFIGHVELGLYSNTSEGCALFAALSAGFELQRFQGYSTWDGGEGLSSARDEGFSGGLRGGIEALRFHDMRARLYAQVVLPVFVSRDVDRGIVAQWTPSASLGISVAF